MGILLFMGNPYQHAPEVSIVRTDTCSSLTAGTRTSHPERLRKLRRSCRCVNSEGDT